LPVGGASAGHADYIKSLRQSRLVAAEGLADAAAGVVPLDGVADALGDADGEPAPLQVVGGDVNGHEGVAGRTTCRENALKIGLAA